MKRTALILLISGFWLLVSGFFTHIHAQDETLTLLTYYPAPYGVYNRLQIGSNPANGILLEASDVSPNAGYIRFGDNTGWKLHFGRYRETTLGAPNTGTTGVLMTIQDNGNIGIGTRNPTEILGLNGDDWRRIKMERRTSPGGGWPLVIQAGGAFSGGENLSGGDLYLRSGISTGGQGSRIHFSTATPGTSGTSDRDPSIKMEILENGNVGIGTVNPSSLLHVSAGSSGDAVFRLEADNDNNNENDNPEIRFIQDGNNANAFIGLEGNAGIRSTGTLGNALVIGSEDNDPAVQFVTNDNVRMTILTNGDVGIGTNNPTIKFAIAGGAIGLDNDQNLMAKQSNGTYSNLIGLGTDDNTYVNIAPGAHPYGGLRIWNKGGNERSLMKILPSGKIVMYGTSGTDTISSPQFTLSLHGTAAKSTAGDWAALSDIRLKENIQPINNALDKMIQLRGITFQWKEPEKHGNQTGSYMGMTAQDVEGVFPEWVGEFDEGYKTLCFIGFEALATEAIKELKAENDALKTKNAELESRIKTLEDKIISK